MVAKPNYSVGSIWITCVSGATMLKRATVSGWQVNTNT